MAKYDAMLCTTCNERMNLHAMKVDTSGDAEVLVNDEVSSDEVLREFHSCPDCGTTATRQRADWK